MNPDVKVFGLQIFFFIFLPVVTLTFSILFVMYRKGLKELWEDQRRERAENKAKLDHIEEEMRIFRREKEGITVEFPTLDSVLAEFADAKRNLELSLSKPPQERIKQREDVNSLW